MAKILLWKGKNGNGDVYKVSSVKEMWDLFFPNPLEDHGIEMVR